jgi:outer membrane receptor protein involved in Fe transport
LPAWSTSRTDVALSCRWQKLTATVAVDNLFNEHYQAVVGFPNPWDPAAGGGVGDPLASPRSTKAAGTRSPIARYGVAVKR